MHDITQIMTFLKQVKKNNRRDWFEKNKKNYQSSLNQFRALVQDIIKGLGKDDPEIALLDAKSCVYRIYRDIRFSNDKTPYKTHFGAFLAPGGKSSGQAGYYLHLQPGNESLAGGGLYHPPAEHLKKVRQEIDYNGSELMSIMRKASFRKYFKEIQGDKLVRPPKGYAPDHPNIEFLKLKDYLVLHFLSDAKVKEKNFHREAIRIFRAMRPFVDFLNVAIS